MQLKVKQILEIIKDLKSKEDTGFIELIEENSSNEDFTGKAILIS